MMSLERSSACSGVASLAQEAWYWMSSYQLGLWGMSMMWAYLSLMAWKGASSRGVSTRVS